MWGHREVLAWLARSDFQVRYKRASLGIAWSVLVPLLQGIVLIIVFGKFTRFDAYEDYSVFVLSGVLCWTFFTAFVNAGSTAIVDRSDLTDKVWFPRALLPLVPGGSAMVGFATSLGLVVLVAPLLGTPWRPRLLLLPVGILMMVAFCSALVLLLSALHVYFRDVRFLVQAALLVLFWLTPIAYPQEFVGGLAPWLSLNPMTGILTVFRLALIGDDYRWLPNVAMSVASTVALTLTAIEVHRRRDRLFVDLL